MNFNSIKVRLEHLAVYLLYIALYYFNSIKVRLEQHHQLLMFLLLLHFNSIKVRLELLDLLLIRTLIGNFNSIEVRLELNPYFAVGNMTAFQFHKGTIRTTDPFICDCHVSVISIP